MTDQRVLLLYSTPACHLCETAHALIAPHLAGHNLVLESIDISESDELVDRYGIRIPVLRFEDGQDELGWPFDDGALLTFIGQAG